MLPKDGSLFDELLTDGHPAQLASLSSFNDSIERATTRDAFMIRGKIAESARSHEFPNVLKIGREWTKAVTLF